MNEARHCSQCGQPLPRDVRADVCPACELGGALVEGVANTRVLDQAGRKVTSPLAGLGVFGDYEILEEIARGGMGVVYKARQISLDRTVALKTILRGLASKEFILRFRSEAATAANLQHPNIVAIHEVGVHQGENYLAMDYVDGPNLAEHVGQQPLPPKQAALHVKVIAQAIQFAHDRNVLHRDLKPANILIDAHGQPRITDFGLAKRLNSETDLTHTGQVLGSPNYIPPEQVAGNKGKTGRASDVYGLGGILYFTLTARAPYQAESFAQLVHEVLNAEPAPPHLLNPRVPRDLETICLKCLEKEPSKRYGSAQQLAEELDRFLADEPIQARPAGAIERTWRWCKRKPALAAALGAAACLLLVVVLGAPLAIVRIERERLRAENEATLAQSRLYLADMSLAQQAVKEGNFGRARSLLQRHLPSEKADLRGWEWFRFHQESEGDDLALIGKHANEVAGVTVSPDGLWMASASTDGEVFLWSAATLQVQSKWKMEGRITAFAFSPDSQFLATLSQPGGCRIWSLSPVRETAHFPVPQSYFSGALAFAPRGKIIAVSSGAGKVELWKYEEKTKKAELAPEAGSLVAMVFDHEGRTLIAAGDGGWISLIDVETQKQAGRLEGCGGYTASLALAPGGSKLAFGGYDGAVRVWNLPSQKLEVVLTNHHAAIMAVAFSPDGTTLASAGGDQTIRCWRTSDWQASSVLRGHESVVRTLGFLQDGRTIVSGSSDQSIRVWQTAPRPKPANRFQFSSGVAAVGVLPMLRKAALVKYDRTVQLIDLESLREDGVISLSIDTSDVWGGGVCLSGKPLAIGNHIGMVSICDPEQMKELAAFQAHPDRIRGLAIAQDGKTAATMGEDGAIKLWDLQPSPKLRVEREGGKAFWLSFSPNGRHLAATLENGSIALWNGATLDNPIVFAAHKGAAVGTAFSRDGRLLATASWDGTAKVWELATHRLLATLQSQLLGVNCLAFSPDGRRLAVGSQDGSVKVWDTLHWQEVAAIAAHATEVWDIAFLPSDNTLVSASRSELRMWPVRQEAFSHSGGRE